jgi:hypothetical protein
MKPRAAPTKPENLPDIHAEFKARGESEFQLWLRDQPVAVLRALIRGHDMDAARRTSKWKDADNAAMARR